MRSDTELINKITALKAIKPREEWVVLTKKEVLGWEPRFGLRFIFKPAFASLAVICMLVGVGVFAKGSLPGDLLYPIKKAGEKVAVSLMPEKSRSNMQLTIANDKLESIVKVAQANQSSKIIPIVKEYQSNISEAAQNLKKTNKNDVKGIAQVTKKIEENKEKIEKTYGVLLGENKDLDEALGQIVKGQIEDLDKATLSQPQQEILKQIKDDFSVKNYQQALEKIISLNFQEK
jgi:hypothetical protein